MIAVIFSIIVFSVFTIVLIFRWVGEILTEVSSDLVGLTIIWWVVLIILHNTLWNF